MRQKLVSRCQELASRYPSPRNFTARRLVEEGVPMFGIAMFWGILGWITQVGTFHFIGLVMIGFYVVVRGVALAPDAPDDSYSFDVQGVLYENASLLPSVLTWILIGFAVALLFQTLFGWWLGFLDSLHVFLSPALGIVVLYAIANGIPLVRHYEGVSPDFGTGADETAESGSDPLGE